MNPFSGNTLNEVTSDCSELITLLSEYSPGEHSTQSKTSNRMRLNYLSLEAAAERSSSPGSLLGGQRRGKLNAVHIIMTLATFLKHFGERCQKLEESETVAENYVSTYFSFRFMY